MLVVSLPPSRAEALVEPFDATYVMADEEFNDSYAMSCDQIQEFLNGRTGALKNYVLDGKSAAQIVCEQSNRFGINPRLILVLLQKEQGLLGETEPSQDALDWAAGCGPGWDEAKGFAYQVECAARTLRRRFDSVPLGDVVDNVVPVNRATLALYRYNNHQQGNQDFWRIWTKYWPMSAASPMPTEIVVDSRFLETTPAIKEPCKSGWVVGTQGLNGHHLVTPNASGMGDSTNSAIWRPNIPREGAYQVSAFIPNRAPIQWPCSNLDIKWDTSHAEYTVKHRDGLTTYEVDQGPISDGWVNIGTYYFSRGTDDYVMLSDLTGEPSMTYYVSFDEVKFVWVAP
ncbi:MAG: hypothetical protein M1546_10430 [Chloroflexi bacterium]|nr:hypothetical protein [Chloroflexota bacterium]